MRAKGNKEKIHIALRILFWINILNSCLLLLAYLSTHISPETNEYLPFFGLGYPVWLGLAMLFIVFWIIKESTFVWVSIFTILIGFNHLRHFFVVTVFSPSIESPIKLMSFNVKIFDFFNLENRVENRNKIFSFLNEEKADIICFQEFFHQDGKTDFVTRDSMVDLLGFKYSHEHYTHDMALSRYFGLATFSKYPIINEGGISFENDNNNYCIYSDIVIESDTVRVFNGHIGSIRFQNDDYSFFGDEGPGRYMDKEVGHQILSRLKMAFQKRAIQAEKIGKEIDLSPYPVVVCMDMNDTPVSYAYRQFGTRLCDAFIQSGNGIGTTYIGKMPSNRIDYIFHSNSVISSNFTTHQVEYSDHKPISCELGFE